MAPFRRERACAFTGWLATLWLFTTSAAQPVDILHPAAAAAAGAAGAGAAECRLEMAGGEGRLDHARMSCTNPEPTIALASHLGGMEENFTGVFITRSCNGSWTNTSSCLVTICSGRLVLRASSVSGVRGIPLEAVVCVVGGSRLEVHNSSFSHNLARPLAVFDQAHLLLNATAVHNNSVNGSGGGLLIEGGATVTITGRSRVHGNNASEDGGGLVARGHAVLRVDGGSSVRDNSAGQFGGGLAAFDHVSITITGDSSVQGNVARNRSGGGLSVWDSVACLLTDGSRVHSNRAARSGAGVWATNTSIVSVMGCSVDHNKAGAGGAGGGIRASDTARVVVGKGSSVHGNTAARWGGGLAVIDNATVRISNGSSVHGNTADEWGGGLAVSGNADVALSGGSSVHGNTAAKLGGGLLVVNATVRISNGSSVYNNTASNHGGGLAVGGNGAVALSGGSSVHSNTAAWSGGGLYVGDNATVTISRGSSVHGNSCSGGDGRGGGGIAVAVLYNVTLDASGRAVSMQRRAFLDMRSHVSINNSTVTNNTSIRSPGGGLAVGGKGTIELVNGSVLSYNRADNSSGGGAMLYGNGSLRADDSVMFVDNAVSKTYVGSTIAAFDNSTLYLPVRGPLTKCSVGVYLGQSACQAGEVRQHDMCVCCQQHTFSFTNGSCQPCPRNGNCTGGSLVQPLPGYWSSAPTSVQMHRCPLSTTACNIRVVKDSIQQCNTGYTGPLCGACQLGPVEQPEYGMLSPFRCGKCLQPKMQLGLYLLLSFVSVVFVTCTVHATWQDNLSGDKVVLVTDLIKVLVLYLQYAAIIGSVSVPWPLLSIQSWFQAVNIVFAVGSGQVLSLDCWLHHYIPQGQLPIAMQRQFVYFLAPVCVLLAVVVLQWLSWALGRWVVPLVWRQNGRVTQQPAMLVLRKLPVTLLVLIYYAYPTLVRAALSFFACLRIDRDIDLPPAATAPLNHTAGYWVSDINQACFTGYHKGWALGLGLPSILLWCIAVPVAMGLGLFLCRARADIDSFREHFGFLYRSYRPERVWWEAVWAARTVVLTLISVFAFPMERHFSVLSLLVVFWASASLQSICQSYAFPTLHRMHMVSTSCLFATTLGALAMFAYEIQDSTALQLRIAIAVLVLLVNVAFVGWCLWKLVPVVKKWCMIVHSGCKSQVLKCVGHPTAGQRYRGPPRRRRGDAGSCSR